MRLLSAIVICSSTFTALLSAPSACLSDSTGLISVNGAANNRGEIHTKTIILMDPTDQISTLEIATRDFYSDIIRSYLRMEVNEFLALIDQSLSRKRTHTLSALSRVNEIKKSLDPETALKLDTLVANKLQQAVDNVTPIANDLKSVLPAISNRINRSRDVADLIHAILQRTLEQLLREIQTALEVSDQLLVQTMNDLITISNSVSNAQLAKELREVSTLYLAHARAAIRPVLDSLYQVIPPMHISSSRRIVADIFSEVLRFDVIEAANMFNKIWTNLNDTLQDSLGRLENIPLAEHIKAEVKSAVIQTVEEGSKSLSPLLHVLAHFAYGPNTNQLSINRDLPKDIVDTLIGISLYDFLNYIDFAVNRTKELGDAIKEDVIRQVSTFHPELGVRIAIWAHTTVHRMKVAIKPFLDLIDPIMPPSNNTRKWASVEKYSLNRIVQNTTSKTDEEFCDFSLKTGQNKEYIFQIVSKIFKIEMSQASEVLIASMLEVENMLNYYFDRLSYLLRESNVELDVMDKLHSVIEGALNDTKRTIQPGLDIFLLFAPNNSISDRDVMAGIITTMSSITLDTFVQYSRGAVVFQGFIVESAISEINNVLASNNVDPNLEVEIQEILLSAVQSGSKIMSPFISAISEVL